MYAKHFKFKKSTSNRTNTAVERIASNKEKTRVSGKIEWKKHKIGNTDNSDAVYRRKKRTNLNRMLKVFSKNIPFFRCSSWYTWVCVFVRSDHFICIVVLSLPFSYVNTQTHRHSRKIRWANIWATWLSYFSSIQIFIEFDLLILCCLSVLETRSCAHAHAYARSLAHLPTKPFYQCVWLMQCVGMCFIGNSISLAFEKMRKREREAKSSTYSIHGNGRK